MSEKNPDEIGALWKKTSAKSQYLSGSLEVNGQKINIVCFLNTRKQKESQPDYRILISRPRDAVKSGIESQERNQSELNNLQKNEVVDNEQINPDDIPF